LDWFSRTPWSNYCQSVWNCTKKSGLRTWEAKWSQEHQEHQEQRTLRTLRTHPNWPSCGILICRLTLMSPEFSFRCLTPLRCECTHTWTHKGMAYIGHTAA
jgi:hypothetical protein